MSKREQVIELGNGGWMSGTRLVVKASLVDAEALKRGAHQAVTFATKNGERLVTIVGVHALSETKSGKATLVCDIDDGVTPKAVGEVTPRHEAQRSARGRRERAEDPRSVRITRDNAPATVPASEVDALRAEMLRLAEQVATLARALADKGTPDPTPDPTPTKRATTRKAPAPKAPAPKAVKAAKAPAPKAPAAADNGGHECGICGGPAGKRGYRHVAAPDVVACNDCLDLTHEEVRALVGARKVG